MTRCADQGPTDERLSVCQNNLRLGFGILSGRATYAIKKGMENAALKMGLSMSMAVAIADITTAPQITPTLAFLVTF